MELSARLLAVANMVTKDNRVCDVGCDHGYVSIYLVEQGISPYVYAMDVNRGPLERAKEHIRQYGLENRIETILSDGLLSLENRQSDALVCAGMGGKLMIKILQEGTGVVSKMQELILQPQSEIHQVRAFLRAQGYYIDKEDMVYEDGKFYPILHVLVSSKVVNEVNGVFDKFGPNLLKEKHPVLLQYLEYIQSTYADIEQRLQKEPKTDKIFARMVELKKQKEELTMAMNYFK